LEKDLSNPKILKELNILIQKRDELQEGLKQFRNKVAINSKLGLQQKLLLCQSTKQINNVNILQNSYIFNLIYIHYIYKYIFFFKRISKTFL